MIATDHAPHSEEEKSRGLEKSLNGIVGLETAFPVLYTGLVLPGILSLEKLVDLMSGAPRRRFGLMPSLQVGAKADFTIFDLDAAYDIDPATFLSKGHSTPSPAGTSTAAALKPSAAAKRFGRKPHETRPFYH